MKRNAIERNLRAVVASKILNNELHQEQLQDEIDLLFDENERLLDELGKNVFELYKE